MNLESNDNEITYQTVSNQIQNKKKVFSADIIVRRINGTPYYEIKYQEVGKKYYTVGYGSYCLDYVFEWKEECFIIVEKKNIFKRFCDKIKEIFK